ncbi:MAG: bifunctional (p)ppGpp synthetase/guanosine-3',5'-bis(diphosphate) 3'-pyrophosphohydrolase [Sphingobacteriia bacterium]|nr:RelA/SpoT family protein [Paludibacteraceae bacterium]NCA78777.1 bifunctional (p)ppGpp synthetase/guanosine-3',5'-bis(diphosphate) 3'-pyrophosphohydrolase [Sphingobacteriia bacterium]
MKNEIADKTFKQLYRELLYNAAPFFALDERKEIQHLINETAQAKNFSLAHIEKLLRVAILGIERLGLGHTAVLSVLLYETVQYGLLSIEEVEKRFGKSSAIVISGLIKVHQLYDKKLVFDNENFRKLLMSFAEDIRVIMIVLVERLDTMYVLNRYPKEDQQTIARETSYLYAPLAHRLGLYQIKTELEDLSLKFTSNEIYKDIAHKLNATKAVRDKYITEFITPVEKELQKTGLKFEIKGRTKSIFSIWNKIRKKQVPFEKIYDLFAIRIILDVPTEQEKAACWQVYSVVTDMYSPNPNRLRDWLSMPKSNGYESLHITVLGPEAKWVEVQIRTRRMDEIAEKGMAAHWKYKGGTSEGSADNWLAHIRELLANPDLDAVEILDEFRVNVYDEEVFVFTPKGEVKKFAKGSTILDFAFSIHSNIGSHCVGALVNGKHVPIRYELQNGDQISVSTLPSQKPKTDWLQWVHSSKAKSKIRQALKEIQFKDAESGKELLQRRLKNWKVDCDESMVTQLARKLNYKTISDFYQAVNSEKVSMSAIRDCLQQDKKEIVETSLRSAENFSTETDLEKITSQEDVLVIDQGLKNIQYTLAKCCNPIYGDDIFGFVSINGGIKIHRCNCPNAPQMMARFGYRMLNARWAGKNASQYPIRLRVVGHDDIGIVSNITSIIGKTDKVKMRSISVDSNDAGLFEGNITVMVEDLGQLEQLTKTILTIKGVKSVSRI